jgi:pimeloyl-ACP methyl ester carboxylesterase
MAAARALADLKQDWKLEVYEDVGHVPHLEVPDRFATTVLEWLERKQSAQEVKA